MKKLFLLLLLLISSGCNDKVCCSGGPPSFNGGFIFDSYNNLHLLYTNTKEGKINHLERIDGKWKKEVLNTPYGTNIENLRYEKENLCIYYDTETDRFHKTCKEKEGGWNTVDLKRSYVQGRVFHIVGKLLAITSEKENGAEYNKFFIMNDQTGEKSSYLPDLNIELIQNYNPPDFKVDRFSTDGWLFYDNGQWDGISFIYFADFSNSENTDKSKYKTSIYYVYYENEKWNIEEINENSLDISGSLNYIFLKNKKITLIDRTFIIKKDLTNNRVVIESFLYKEIFNKIYNSFYRGRLYGVARNFKIDIIDQDEKIHAFVDEWTDSEVKLYYHIYNPASDTPEKPEVREHIETRKW